MKHSDESIHITGQVTSGQGAGAFFTSQDHYKKNFLEKLGYIPYTGTLKIQVHQDTVPQLLQKQKGTTIEGFHTENTFLGKVKCFTGTLRKAHRGQDCTVILPEKSTYTTILEIIAPINLRKDLDLTDGDTVEITIKA